MPDPGLPTPLLPDPGSSATASESASASALAGTGPVDGALRRVAFGIGANLGDRWAALQLAVDTLAATPGIEVIAASPVVETDPVGGPDQPAYLNAVVVADSGLPAPQLLAAAHAAEQIAHRTRAVRWGPRTLDVDVLVVGAERSDDPVLTLPHPRAHERGFVLVPWAAVDPEAPIPGRGPVGVIAETTGSEGVYPRPHLHLRVNGRTGIFEALQLVTDDWIRTGGNAGFRAVHLTELQTWQSGEPPVLRARVGLEGRGASSSAGMFALAADFADPTLLAELANEAQDLVGEVLWEVWPVCPSHALGLRARVHKAHAWWHCPAPTSHWIAPVGELPAPPTAPRTPR